MADPPLFDWTALPSSTRARHIEFWRRLYTSVIIGTKPPGNGPVIIGESERKSGLYILGKPRMGKSWLIVNMILQDIENGHGVDDLLKRTTSGILVFDPEDESYSFGINLLDCANIDNVAARNDTFNKAKGVFDKLWKNTFEDKPWLQLVLQNTIHAFIETPGLTLLELPIFYRNRDFRDYVVGNIRYNWQVRDYWQRTFAAKSLHDQNEQMEAAQTRAEIMLAHPYVSDIVGQTHTTIDFARILDEKKIVLVRLSNRLSYEAKTIIGTILASELLHAIEHRPEGRRGQFCIYIDEFQNFASYQDFPTLITQAPKYGIATTLAHHERYGQLAGNPGIIGATAAIANKVLFQITGRDAQELAPEFAEAPATETRYEEKYIISREPVHDLLRWHDNPQIREFANSYIRPLKERLEDIREESETERLIRMEELDASSLFRLEERTAAARPERRIEALSSVGQSLISIGAQTRKLRTLSEEAADLRLTFRDLNKFLTGVMEGTLAPGQEEFSRFLIQRLAGLSYIEEAERQILKIYVTVAFGDPSVRLVCPYAFAKKYGLFEMSVVSELGSSMYRYSQAIDEYRKKCRAEMKERLERLRLSVTCGEEYLAERKRLYDKWDRMYNYDIPWEESKDEECKERERDLARDKEEKDDLEQNFETKLQKYVDNFDNSSDGFRLRKMLAPADFATTMDTEDEEKVIQACKKELGTAGQAARQIILEFVNVCALLAKPENHITKKSGQHTAKQVNTRTEADMSNEMVRNLTSLPKYTAYAKVLQSEGQNIWKGKIRTRELRATNDQGADTSETWRYIQARTRIREEIIERHDSLLDKSGGGSKPPPASY